MPLAPSRSRTGLHPAWMIVLTSLWMATACNLPLWRAVAALPHAGALQGWGFGLAFGAIVAAGNTLVLALLGWGRALKPVLALAVLMAACGAYFMGSYGIVIDTTMLTNVVQTDVREAGDLFNARLLGTVALLAGPPLAWLAWQPRRPLGAWRHLLHSLLLAAAALVVVVVSLLLVFQDFASTMRNQPKLRYLINPLNTLYALGDLAATPYKLDDRTLQPLGRDARLGASYDGQAQPPVLVLVLGETARASNFGVNGYARDTTPLLAARTDVVSAPNAWSCGTSTASSVPCMFSHLGRTAFEARKANSETLIDVLAHAGLAVLWIDNQAGCKGVCDRAPNVATTTLKDPHWCPSGECLDGVMLQGLDERLAALPTERRARGTVLVLHQMGSHGPAYFKRSLPAHKRFLPECATTALQQCTREEILNAYDNSIRDTDQFLASVIDWLQARPTATPTALLYVSDHGESLGENNIYLHGLPYAIAPDAQKHVPWITWLSPAMQARKRITTACLRADQAQRRITHDDYFHSVLGLMDVHTEAYQPAHDLFAACKTKG